MDRFIPFMPNYGSPAAPSYPTADLAPLSQEVTADGKSLHNPARPDSKRSEWYDGVWAGDGGPDSKSWWDFHVYHLPENPEHDRYARELHEAVRREFPELRVYRFFDRPLGPHPVPMFEVNVFNPEQLGTLLSWFVANRGPCSVLIHPNTGDDYADHTTHATWIGDKVPLNVDMLKALESMKAAQNSARS